MPVRLASRRWIALCALGIALGTAGTARAATFNVNTTADLPGPGGCAGAPGDCSLRRAFALANANGDPSNTIVVPASTSNYVVNVLGALPATKTVTLLGAGAGSTVIDGTNANRILVDNAGTLTISGLTFTRGNFSGPGPNAGGGAVAKTGTGDLNVSNSAFTANGATVTAAGSFNGGGAIYTTATNLNITNTTFTGNALTVTGGVGFNGGGAVFGGSGGLITIAGSTFRGNGASVTATGGFNGGGAVANQGSALTLTGSAFASNSFTIPSGATGNNGGGALFNSSGGVGSITGTSFRNDAANLTATGNGNGGGAVHNEGATLTMADDSIAGAGLTLSAPTSANGGGGLYNSTGGPLNISRTAVTGSTYTQAAGGAMNLNGGGGIHDEGSALTLTDSTLAGNTADITATNAGNNTGGGGLFINTGGALTVSGSAITGNAFRANTGDLNGGGGIHDEGASPSITNSTLAGNSSSPSGNGATRGGGALFASFGAPPGTLTAATVAGNAAEGAGGSLLVRGGTVTLRDAILSGGAASGLANDCATSAGGTIPSAGHNIESADTCGLGAAGDQKNTNPLLGPLGANGGPTQTQMPLAGSPAIDRGDTCPSPDQRGVPRPQGAACDVGAVEVQPPTVVTGAATGVSFDRATLGGLVNPNASATAAHLDYGTTAFYGASSAAQTLAPGIATQGIGATVTGLKPRTTYHFRVVASNAAGRAAGSDMSFKTQPLIPSVSGFGMTRRRFRRSSARTPVSARVRRSTRGTAFTFRLSQDATVRIAIDRLLPGRKVGKRCLVPTRARRHRKRCTRTSRAGTLTRRYPKGGKKTVAFSGRIGRRALAPGSYRATITATTSGQPTASKSRSVTFTILSG